MRASEEIVTTCLLLYLNKKNRYFAVPRRDRRSKNISFNLFQLQDLDFLSACSQHNNVHDNYRVATAQGKQGIWFLLFPDREKTGNFVLTQGKIC